MGASFLRRGGVGALAMVCAGAVACGDDAGAGGPPSDGGVDAGPAVVRDGGTDGGPAFGGEPTIRVGTGCDVFFSWRPLEDGARLPLEAGFQGAQHFWVGIRGWNLPLDEQTAADPARQRTTGEQTYYRLFDQADGALLVEEDLGDRFRLWPTPELGDEPHRTNLGFLVISNELRERVLAATLTVEVERRHEGETLTHRIEDVTGFPAPPCEPPDEP